MERFRPPHGMCLTHKDQVNNDWKEGAFDGDGNPKDESYEKRRP